MFYAVLSALIALTFAQVQGSSFVHSIDKQWPWYQWTTTEPSTGSSTQRIPVEHPTAPPPPVTPRLPSLESDMSNYIMVTDPSDGRIFYIPSNLFWNRFPGLGGAGSDSSNPSSSNPTRCDLSSSKCWPSGGGQSQPAQVDLGVRTSAYWKPNRTTPPPISNNEQDFAQPSLFPRIRSARSRNGGTGIGGSSNF